MYRSLRAVRYTENILCQEIAVGKKLTCKYDYVTYCVLIKFLIANHDSSPKNTLIKCDPLVEKLWTGGQQQSINKEQKESVRIAVENKLQLIQGPPGT